MMISAERICVVLRSRGYPTANVEGYKPLLRSLNPADHTALDFHLRRIVMGADDQASLKFIEELTQLAHGRQVDTSDPILSKLKPYSTPAERPQVGRWPAQAVSPPQGMEPAATSLRTGHEREVIRKKHYVYGQRCAYMFELDWLKARPNQAKQKRTLTVEAALQLAHRSYDWERRISFQLTLLELPQFTAILLGKLPAGQVWNAQNHGRARNKSFRAKEQFDSIFLKLEQAGVIWPVRVGQEHRYQILTLALEALSYNDDHLDKPTILQLCGASLPRVPGI